MTDLRASVLSIQSALAQCSTSPRESTAQLTRALQSHAPPGLPLVSILMCRSCPTAVLSKALGGATGEGSAVVRESLATAVTFLTSAALRTTWDDPRAGSLVDAARGLFAMPDVAAALHADPMVSGGGCTNGTVWQHSTMLMALFAIGPVEATKSVREVQRETILTLIDRPAGPIREEYHRRIEAQVGGLLALMREMLRGTVHRGVGLRWITNALKFNAGYQKERHEGELLSSPWGMLHLAAVAAKLAEPVASTADFPRGIPAEALYNPGAAVSFALHATDVVERIDAERAGHVLRAAEATPHEYPPKVTLFFAAARALNLTVIPAIREVAHYDQILHRVSEDQKKSMKAIIAMREIQLSSAEISVSALKFYNSLASWLLHVSGASADGTLPGEVPAGWCLLPQAIVDDALYALQLLTRFKATVSPGSVTDILGLSLVLGGNVAYFPKPHTHAIFPSIVVELLQSREYRASLMDHYWFEKHIVTSLVRVYIAVESVVYEKTMARYHVCCCLGRLLKDTKYCEPARKELENELLERFTHMVTGEANGALDEALQCLTFMKSMEDDGTWKVPAPQRQNDEHANNRNENDNDNENRDEEGDDPNARNEVTYAAKGRLLTNSLLLFRETIAVFDALSENFSKGILKNLVARQICDMLTRSIVKLAGPRSRELRITDMEKYEFRPRELLEQLVSFFAKMCLEESFFRQTISIGLTIPDILASLRNIVNPQRPLLASLTLQQRVRDIIHDLDGLSAEHEEETALWDDAPEFALCGLLADPLTEPVALPTEGEGLTFVNLNSIHHALLAHPVHPFTRAPLTTDDVRAFNERPDVRAAVADLQRRITEWKSETLEKLRRE